MGRNRQKPTTKTGWVLGKNSRAILTAKKRTRITVLANSDVNIRFERIDKRPGPVQN